MTDKTDIKKFEIKFIANTSFCGFKSVVLEDNTAADNEDEDIIYTKNPYWLHCKSCGKWCLKTEMLRNTNYDNQSDAYFCEQCYEDYELGEW